MEDDEQDRDFVRAIILLDGAEDALSEAARREEKRERGKPMRQVTEQQRAETCREFVEEMAGKYGVPI